MSFPVTQTQITPRLPFNANYLSDDGKDKPRGKSLLKMEVKNRCTRNLQIMSNTVNEGVQVITVYEDRSYTFVVKQPLMSDLIKNALKIQKGSGKAGTESAGLLTKAQALEIAKVKMPDLNANDEEAAIKVVAGTARSMGIQTDF